MAMGKISSKKATNLPGTKQHENIPITIEQTEEPHCGLHFITLAGAGH